MRFLAFGAAAVAVAAASSTAAARSTMVDDQAPILRRAVAAGLQVSGDNLWQTRGPDAVLGAAREVESVPSSALAGKSPAAMASVLRAALRASGGHYAVIDDAGPVFRGAQGDALAAAFAILGREASPWGGGTMARRVHLYVNAAAGGVLTEPAQAGLRTALARSGGLWLKTTGWSAQRWLTWPAELTRQVAPRGLDRTRIHVAIHAGDQARFWARAKNGSACVVLDNGPAAYRVGDSIEAFAAEYRRAFTRPAADKAAVEGCTPAPVLPPAGASALVASMGRETTGLEIPPGGLVTPPLVAGEPAQVTLQLGADPLGIAAGLDVAPEAVWEALAVVVQVRGPGVAVDVPIAGDGAAPIEFTPTAPGPVTMRIIVRGSGVSTALGAPTDMVAPLAATPGGPALLPRVVANPDSWSVQIPLHPTGGGVGQPVLEIVPPLG
jgi:hypothetical protein